MDRKVVLKVDVFDDKAKQKAMKIVSSIPGVTSLSMDMKDKKMTVIGDVDPVSIVCKLKKVCHTEIITVGPAKEPEKKAEPKKPEEKDQAAELVKIYQDYYTPYTTHYYVRNAEQDPNACVIC